MSQVTGASANNSAYLRELQEQLEEELRNARQKADALETRSERKSKEHARRLEEKFTQAAEKLREEHDAAATRERNNGRSELARLKGEVYTPVRRAVESEDQARREMTETLRIAEDQRRTLASSTEKAAEERIAKGNRAADERILHDTETLRDSHGREVSQLTGELMYAKSVYDRDLGRQKAADTRRSEVAQKHHNEKLEDQARIHIRQMRDAESAHNEEFERMESGYRKEQDRVEAARTDEHELYLSKLEEQKQAQVRRFEETEGARTRAQSASFKTSKAQAQAQITELESELHQLKTSSDPSDLSPEALRNLKERMVGEIEAQARLRIQASEDKFTHLTEKSRQNYQELQSQSQHEEALASQELAHAETLGRMALTQLAQETQFDKEKALRSKDDQLLRTTDGLQRTFSRQILEERRHFEESIEALRNDAIAKRKLEQQEADFQLRMERRASASQQNELIREYEKRILLQKQELVDEMRSAKTGWEKSLQEQERKHRQEVEELSGLKDRQLAQLEQQYQERERVSARNHQEEIEKLKRTHALLIAKKS